MNHWVKEPIGRVDMYLFRHKPTGVGTSVSHILLPGEKANMSDLICWLKGDGCGDQQKHKWEQQTLNSKYYHIYIFIVCILD